MRALVIYDLTGYIWNIIYGADEEPSGLLCMWVDIPENSQLTSIDVSDPLNHKPVFSYSDKNTDIKILQDKVAAIEERLNPTFDSSTCTLDEAKNYIIARFSEACTAAIYNGQEVETSVGKFKFSFNNNDQINLKEVFDLSYLTGLDMAYHANGVDCTMWSTLDILKIYSTNVYAKTYHTTYCNLLNNLCRSAESKDEVLAMYYGMTLPSRQNDILYEILADVQKVFDKLYTDFLSKSAAKESDSEFLKTTEK